jgi:integrase
MTRRGPGEGSIRERSDGTWEARLRHTLDGRQERRSVYGRTRAEVRSKLAELARARSSGLAVDGGRQTVAVYLERWAQDVAAHRVRPSTLHGYRQLIRVHIAPVVGDVRLDKLTAQHLSRLYSAALAGENGRRAVSPRRVELIHAVLHTALRQAVRWDLVSRNVADLVSPPHPRRPEIRPLTGLQARTLLAAAEGDALLEPLLTLALATGMRQGELLGLTWGAVDLAAGHLEVRASLVRSAGSWSLDEPKTARSRRRIDLAPTAVSALRSHRVRQAEARLLVGSDWQDHDLVFTDAWGAPLDGRHVTSRAFHGLLVRAGLPRIRFHDDRHTYATLQLAAGTHPKLVQEVLGHSTIALTLDIYSHVTPTMHGEAAATMERLLVG